MNEDKIILKLIEHDEALKRIEEKVFTNNEKEKLFSTLEDVATNMKKLQEEHVFTIEWMKRVQAQVDQHEKKIEAIKIQLKMA